MQRHLLDDRDKGRIVDWRKTHAYQVAFSDIIPHVGYFSAILNVYSVSVRIT